MDQPRSHITSGLSLRSDDTSAAFSPHPALPPLTRALLEHRHQELRGQDNAAALLHDLKLARLVADNAMSSLMRELNRAVHPTILADIWRQPELRPELKRHWVMLLNARKGAFRWQSFRPWFQFAADHERDHRAILIFNLLDKLAELASIPDKSYVARVASRFQKAKDEWRAETRLREDGLMEQAEVHSSRLLMHLGIAQKLALEWTPDKGALIRSVRGSLSWQLGFLGWGIAGKLVGAVLNQPIDRQRARRLAKS